MSAAIVTTLVIPDVDGNELLFWLPHDDFSNLAAERTVR